MGSLALYRTILTLVLRSEVRFHDWRCMTTFIWAIVGVLQEKCVHLSKWGLHRSGDTQAASKQRQFKRWLKNAHIDEVAIYRPLVRKALDDWHGATLFLALDSSSLWDQFVIVRLALIYRGRALPLSWIILKHGSTSVALKAYQQILSQAAAILPKGCQVTLLADRGFGDTDLMSLIVNLGWGFHIRVKSSLCVYRANKPSTKVGRLMPERGKALFVQKVWLTDRFFGPVHLALAHVQTPKGYEEWAIVSDEPTNLHTFDEYGLRFDLEENFLDDKSAGFQIESSEIRDAGMLSRLALILATATLYLVSVGTAVVHLGQWRLVDTHWQRGLSYFQMGWRWLRHTIATGKPLHPAFWLEPGPDPYPVYASKAQAARPIAGLFEISLEIS